MRCARWMNATLLAAASAGCGMVSSVQAQRSDARINVVTQRTAGPLRARAEQVGARARIAVARVRLCQSHDVLEGVESVTTTRAPAEPALVSLFGTTGAIVALTGLSVMLYPAFATTPADGSTTISWDTSLPVGGGILGLGGLMLMPWIYTAAASGSSTANRPFREDRPPRSPPQPCGETPERAQVVLGRDTRTLSVLDTDEGGRVEVDLSQVLPPEALRGASPWGALTLSMRDGRSIGEIELAPFRHDLADAAWAAAEREASPNGFERFSEDFPDDPRVASAQSSAARIRRARAAIARDAQRAEAWRDAGDDTARLDALIAERVGDVWEAEAVCRVGRRETSPEALREALSRCNQQLVGLFPEARERHPEILRDAERARDGMTRRIADMEREEAEARAREEAAQARAARRAEAALRSAHETVRSVIADCRGGRARGAAPARRAYESLALLREREGAAVGRLVIQVAAACQCTPSCAGVSSP